MCTWSQNFSLGLVALVSALGCASSSPVRAVRPLPESKPILILAKELGPGGKTYAYGSGLKPDFEISPIELSAGHSANTIVLKNRLPRGTEHWSVVSLGTISTSHDDPVSEFWRQGQFQVHSSPPQMAIDEYGRFMPVRDFDFSLELDLGTPHQPKFRRDTAVVSLQGHLRGASGQAFRLGSLGGVFSLPAGDHNWRVTGIRSLIESKETSSKSAYIQPLGVLAKTATVVRVEPILKRRTGRLVVQTSSLAKSVHGLPAGPWLRSTEFDAARHVLEQKHGAKRPEKSQEQARAELRKLLQLGAPGRGYLAARDSAQGIVFEEWHLPTSSGTKGVMIVAKPSVVQSKKPGLLYLCGHFLGGARHPQVRQLLSEAVKSGFIAAAVDLMGFGYRQGQGAAHIYGSYLTLLGQAGLRAFVEETETAFETFKLLPEVEVKNIGVSGISMGGSLAMILGALREDVRAVVAMAGTPDFASFVRPIGSDSEQHSWKFQAFGGFERLPSLITPRPLRLIMARDDHEHGRSSSQRVLSSASEAYRDTKEAYRLVEGLGKHDQELAARQDVLKAMASALELPLREASKPKSWLPPASPVQTRFKGLRELAFEAESQEDAQSEGHWSTVAPVEAVIPTSIGITGPRQELLALPTADEGVSNILWHFRAVNPYSRVLLLDDAGRLGAAFAPLLQRCGVDVSVLQPRLFGTSGSWHQAWHRKLLSLASTSLDQPLTKVWLHELANGIQAKGPYDAVLVMGPESGALALLAAASGVFKDAHLFLAEAPDSLSHRMRKGLAPYWTTLLPEFLKFSDLDQLAQKLEEQGKLTVVNGGESLGLKTRTRRSAIENRADLVEHFLEGYSMKACLQKVPVVSHSRLEHK